MEEIHKEGIYIGLSKSTWTSEHDSRLDRQIDIENDYNLN